MQMLDIFYSTKRSGVNSSSSSSEGETNAPAYDTGSEFHPLQDNMIGGHAAEPGNVNVVVIRIK